MKDIHERTFEFACRVVRLHQALMKRRGADRTIANQLLRAATSVGSNLEEAKAGQSRADFLAKARISLKEARESHYWLRLIEATELLAAKQIHPLTEEANEIVAVLTAIIKKASTSPRPLS
ncbi:MAG: four helix bundle protein [Acidobacteria bacterium]|nr:four helix bundle protein [Acidobacteriota bacterium]MBV9478725.1 four helix bundle protein [Acidobacteriota bacterium]